MSLNHLKIICFICGCLKSRWPTSLYYFLFYCEPYCDMGHIAVISMVS
uniref:Uncharacterized protein n=1 Tax=Anguilla anguilla TaxID=7936 RepID=A0A0E9WGC7_ANGAN